MQNYIDKNNAIYDQKKERRIIWGLTVSTHTIFWSFRVHLDKELMKSQQSV